MDTLLAYAIRNIPFHFAANITNILSHVYAVLFFCQCIRGCQRTYNDQKSNENQKKNLLAIQIKYKTLKIDLKLDYNCYEEI